MEGASSRCEPCHIALFALRIGEGFDRHARAGQCAELFARRVGVECGDFRLDHDVRGRPFFPRAPHISISLSHSGDQWLCALGLQPLGVDVQRHLDVYPTLVSERCFHPAERRMLERAGDDAFYVIWSAKESYVKYTGLGISDEFPCFSVAANGSLAWGVGDAQLALLKLDPGYTLCLCARRIEGVYLARDDDFRCGRLGVPAEWISQP